MNAVLENKGFTTDKGIQIERVFNAPRQLVWDAWTKPEHMQRWWGPRNWSLPVITIDVREGGKYFYCMRSMEGFDIWCTGTYLVVDPISRLEISDSFADENGNIISGARYGMPDVPLEMRVTVTFEEIDGKTKMTMIHEGLPASEMNSALEGWGESFDKLQEMLG